METGYVLLIICFNYLFKSELRRLHLPVAGRHENKYVVCVSGKLLWPIFTLKLFDHYNTSR